MTSGREEVFRDRYASLPPLVLAYVGDAVYEVYVRRYLVERYTGAVNVLHRAGVRLVQAEAQAEAVHYLLREVLTPAEADLVRRGRNAKGGVPRRGVDIAIYRYSTGLECLVGYLYLSGRWERLDEIMEIVLRFLETK